MSQPKQPGGRGSTRLLLKRPVQLNTDEHRVIDEVISVLATATDVFVHQGMLVELVSRDGRLRTRLLTAVRLRTVITRRAHLLRGDKPAHPPEWLLQGVLQHDVWPGVRRLSGLSQGPFLRPDGTACTQSGFDAATGIFCAPQHLELDVPVQATRQDARDALAQLLRPLEDFPFGSRADRAVYLALLLTPFTRFAIDGLTPMFVIDGNAPGIGKTKLVDMVGLISTGEEPPHMSELRNEEEMRKRITSLVMDGSTFAFLDNVATRLGGPCLDSVLTSRVWKDRVLGTQRMVEARSNLIWVATGNNVMIMGDLARRLLWCRLTSLEEAPEARGSFSIGDLRAYVVTHRGRLASAALTVLVAFARAGYPRSSLLPMGSFEEWSGLVRGALVWVGEPDPLATQRDLRDAADDERSEALELLRYLGELFDEHGAFTAADLAAWCHANPSLPLAQLVHAASGARSGQPIVATMVARVLRRYRDLVVDRSMLRRMKKTNRGRLWEVVRTGDGSDAGDGAGGGSEPSSAEMRPASRASLPSRMGGDHAD